MTTRQGRRSKLKRQLEKGTQAARRLREHPYTLVRDKFEIGYDMWLATSQHQHFLAVYIASEPPKGGISSPAGWCATRECKDWYDFDVNGLLNMEYEKDLKILEQQIRVLQKYLPRLVGYHRRPAVFRLVKPDPLEAKPSGLLVALREACR